ncbi:MAG: L,D-transpeptidase family protein [Cereibacter changlensis]
MIFLRTLLALVLAFGLVACGDSKFKTYRGPAVTSVQVHKSARKMYLLHNDRVLKQYDVALGFMPVGHKQFEGDGKTPEGGYWIDRTNPDSKYHLSLGVSYPNVYDTEMALLANKKPGGDIFIHGAGKYRGSNKVDWTAGCIAVTNKEIEEIYSMIRVGTPIYILP